MISLIDANIANTSQTSTLPQDFPPGSILIDDLTGPDTSGMKYSPDGTISCHKPPFDPPPPLPLEKTLSSHSGGTCNGDLVRARGRNEILKENQNIIKEVFSGDENFKSVCLCGKNIVPGKDVEVWERAGEHDKPTKVSYKNLIRCGSVWVCPFCAFKIRTARRDELMTIFEGWQADGYHLIFLTLTKQHKLTDGKYYNREKFRSYNRDWEKVNAHRVIRDLKSQFGIEMIRTIEFTYSSVNGFHPHLHTVLAYRTDFKKLNPVIVGKMISDSYAKKWLSLSKSATMECQVARIVGNKDRAYGKNVAKYIAKVNLIHEMTDVMHKKNTAGIHINPMAIPDMLRLQQYGCYTREQLIEIFRDFYFNVKGTRFMGYTKGLKERYLIEDKTDSEVVSDTEALVKRLFNIEWPVWHLIISHGLEVELVYKVEDLLSANYKLSGVLSWLENRLNEKLCIQTFDNCQDTPLTIDESIDGQDKFVEENEQINRIQLAYD